MRAGGHMNVTGNVWAGLACKLISVLIQMIWQPKTLSNKACPDCLRGICRWKCHLLPLSLATFRLWISLQLLRAYFSYAFQEVAQILLHSPQRLLKDKTQAQETKWGFPAEQKRGSLPLNLISTSRNFSYVICEKPTKSPLWIKSRTPQLPQHCQGESR